MWNNYQNTPAAAVFNDFGLKDESLLFKALPDRNSLAREIRFYMSYYQSNRLLASTKWLGELLVTITNQQNSAINGSFSLGEDSSNDIQMNSADSSQWQMNLRFTEQSDISEQLEYNPSTNFNKVFFEKPSEATDTLNLARALFDLREYRKCSNLLKPLANHKNQSALFLHYYSLFQVSEMTKEEEILQTGDKISCSSVQNKELALIEADLQSLYQKDLLNGINLYLYGVILREKNKKDEAKQVLIQALNKQPLLWSAWLELGSMIKQTEREVFAQIKEHWMNNFYFANFYLEIQQDSDCINLNGTLLRYFPNSVYILNQIAHASYASQEYDAALDWFSKLISVDPFRFENMDLYSNILYIKENFGELAHLAYKVFHNDKYRPESCCVIGNYYSLRGDHHKAVIYFKRAVKLDNKFLSAWTLMGHEYLEMKNTNAAIESYRTAVDIDPKDFRAWYGLGQTYEINQMYNYAAHYYANAALSKPQDSRMWIAMGGCYEKMDRKEEAIKCHEKGERYKDKEGIAMHKLAKLYIQMGEYDKAATCFKENLRRKDNEETESSETTEALMYLAKYCKSQGLLKEAIDYARRLHDYSGTEREEASALIREINNQQQFQHTASNANVAGGGGQNLVGLGGHSHGHAHGGHGLGFGGGHAGHGHQ
ncbi:anaphase-promoting complex subunit 8-like [Stylonychia lemnae]|uniref:Anaphase-promoting complex subunit 8-like n=1 Tax=Stylonychia lemnae TaxID=5949 RepID=A0A078ATJ1_STYLE|nr:anaphase-promoting complex subunit 8-like [Stylonychia lemnae]|eukprot:CDW85316.1 anaphase-promoting complex subunit 8-like [Stylonychia lemnae]